MGLERYVATHNPHIDGPYYWQERIAGDGSFLMPKFRCLAGDDESNDEFHTHYHSRVASPMFQKFRDIGVDELPQLRSVLEGDMSLVGPRATTCDEMNRLAEIAPWGLFGRWERAIRMAKPAIVSLGSGEGYMHPEYYSPDSKLRQMELDIWYA